MSAVADPAPPMRVALLARQGKFLVAEPFFGAGPRVVVSRDRRADVGDLVVVAPARGRSRGGGGRRMTIVRRLGRPDVARDVIRAFMLERGLRGEFEPVVARAAEAVAQPDDPSFGDDGVLAAGSEPVDGGGRRDLRELATFTIDPVTARDFDDAISAQALPGGDGWRVWVHIADVSAYVTPRSPIDREAYRRGTSVYVPGAVEPMLPAALSNHACSLVPGVPRLTVTVELEVGPAGVRSAAFYRSVIRSDERLDYDRVDRIFDGSEAAAEPWGEPLAVARAAARALGEAAGAGTGSGPGSDDDGRHDGAQSRHSGSALVLDNPEPEFRFDDRGNVVETELSVQTESHRLIERLMIAANSQVAQFLSERSIPTLYRVHERPEPTSVRRLVQQLASLGVPTPPVPEGPMTPSEAALIAGEASALVAGWVARTGHGARGLTSLVLRSLKQAVYDHRNLGHAGLGLRHYCHFTSPIRRYPDLICHRALLSAIGGGTAPDATWVANAGPWASTREREAMVIERDADDIARCFALERRLFESGGELREFDGEIVGLIGAGAFVAFGERLGFEGMLPVRRLRGDWWELNEEATMLVGTRNGSVMRLGDPIRVRVGRIDAPRGRVDLLPPGTDDG